VITWTALPVLASGWKSTVVLPVSKFKARKSSALSALQAGFQFLQTGILAAGMFLIGQFASRLSKRVKLEI